MKKIKFDDFVRLNRGFDLPDSQIVEGIYPVVASTNIKAYHNQYKIEPPVVVTGRSGSLGQVQYIDQKCWPLNTSLYSKDFKGNHPKYVCYYLQMMHLEQYNAGAGVPTLNQNHLHNLKILVHDIKDQQKIASILSAYDSQIENNQKRIKLLEQMAENLYKEWFVRFRFPGYESAEFEGGVPKGWKFGKLRDIAQDSGKSEKKENRENYSAYVPIDCIGGHSMVLCNIDTIENAESSLVSFKKTDILFGAMRPYFHKVIMAPFSGLTRSTCFVVSPQNESYRYYLYLLLFQKTSIDYATTVSVGSTMPYTNWKDFSRMPIVIPPKDIVETYAQMVKPIIKSIESIYFSNIELVKQRDLLLPRLMSGKLSI